MVRIKICNKWLIYKFITLEKNRPEQVEKPSEKIGTDSVSSYKVQKLTPKVIND
jgi:hypothetical protein